LQASLVSGASFCLCVVKNQFSSPGIPSFLKDAETQANLSRLPQATVSISSINCINHLDISMLIRTALGHNHQPPQSMDAKS